MIKQKRSRTITACLALLIRDLPAGLFVLSITIAASRLQPQPAAASFLSWILLLPVGITVCIAIRNLSFQAATITPVSVFLLGNAFGHIRQMVAARNFAPAPPAT